MRSSLIYLLLVGLPVVALIWVMRMGSRIVPPPYIGGVWQVQSDTTAVSCRPPAEMEIMQSGIVLDLHMGTGMERADARLRNEQIKSSPIRLADECSGEWQMDARIEGAEGRERLVGEWLPVGCDTCSAMSFSAVKISDNQALER